MDLILYSGSRIDSVQGSHCRYGHGTQRQAQQDDEQIKCALDAMLAEATGEPVGQPLLPNQP